MAQHDYVIANQGFPAFRSDLNNALAAIVSNNSGATEPTTMFAHQMWVDTAANPSILKIRNADNDAWITIGTINQTGDTFTLTSAISATTLNTSGAVVFNDAGADVDFRVEGDTDANLLFVDASTDRVGLGTNTPTQKLHVVAAGGYNSTFSENSANNVRLQFYIDANETALISGYNTTAKPMTFYAGGSQRMTLDTSGNVLVGTTDPLPVTNNDISGIALRADGNAQFSRSGVATARFNRGSTDGDIVSFHKDGTQVGAIAVGSNDLQVNGNAGRVTIGAGTTGAIEFLNANITGLPRIAPLADNAVDIGLASTARFNDAYIVNGVTTGSDRNDKQDIEELSEAEQRVAVAAKALLRKWRWKDAVAKKGDDARIHFGIIAQDLQAAFEAEGLDAGRYAMFMWNEWWETQTEVPAVEAQEAVYETQTDEEGNETQVLVSEAVEGKEAYTRTDTYETEEEAPEGAVRKERMGIRYNELLAFIIAAI